LDMFTGHTFAPYLPLFNVWIVWRPSGVSGIGTGGIPRNTSYGLYRDVTELRGVYCSKPAAARDACRATGPGACDFPTLIGHSPFYGGLGGEFTISTSSVTSGTVVLRHELGHNFGRVGEEYDGGQVYSGANFASSLAQAEQKWGLWLTTRPARAEDSVLRLQDYPWHLLERGAKSYTFNSDGNYNRWFMRFTASGCPEDNSLVVTLDGQPLEWKASGLEDRMFYQYYIGQGFSSGTHTLRFEQRFPPAGQNKRQLCSLTIHEYKNDNQFRWENAVSSYRTWRQGGAMVGYRPTNEKCLMRNMTSPDFCDVCIENNWLQFFRTVNLIDNITVSCNDIMATVKLGVIPLGLDRKNKLPSGVQENYELTWYKNNIVVPDLKDIYTFDMARNQAGGNWKAELHYTTSMIRNDPLQLTWFEKAIYVPPTGPCN